jgi:hypothetical protein
MKKIFCVTVTVVLVICCIITPVMANSICINCENLQANGSANIETDQYMENVTDTPSCNEVMTTDLGTQDIWGSGISDVETSVSGSAYLGQEAPYETTIEIRNGTVTHTGDSIMEVSVGAAADPFCRDFEVSAHTERFSQTDNVISDNSMWSGSNSGACATISATGADGTLGFGVNIQAVDAYESVANDGRRQVGITHINITGGLKP